MIRVKRMQLQDYSRRSKLLLLAAIMLALALGGAILLHTRRDRQDGRWTYQYVIRPSDNGQQLIIGQSIRLKLVVGWQWAYRADGPLKQVAHNTFAGNPQDGTETITAWRRWFCTAHCRVTFTVQVAPDDLLNLCAGPYSPTATLCLPKIHPCR
jgi:hypothetical protein